mmetsp:Transcript_29632/g.79541  ORF Transcript_29632/g.79541 Transcript_29632/m.79541 type:complete len:253 (-) Transcript_29632:342-1100(-)
MAAAVRRPASGLGGLDGGCHLVLEDDAEGHLLELAVGVVLLERLHGLGELLGGRGCGDPLVLEHVIGCVTRLGIDDEELLHEILGVVGHIVPPGRGEVILALHNGGEELGELLLVEGRKAAEKDVEDDPHRPAVHLHAEALVLQDLGRYVAGCAAGCLHDGVAAHHLGQAEVGELDGRVGVRRGVEDVFGLEVAVADPHLMHILECPTDLTNAQGRVRLRVGPPGHNAVKELPAAHKLHHKVDLLGLIEHLV